MLRCAGCVLGYGRKELGLNILSFGRGSLKIGLCERKKVEAQVPSYNNLS
jgi:hypothetical protein